MYGLGVAGYWGSIIEIEAAAYPAHEKGKGSIRFNETAGSMAKDSVATAASVVRMCLGRDLSDYDLHINVIGGGNIDGPSAGCAITSAILSAVEKVPLRQDVALTGEISLTGEVKPVGGIAAKAFGACQAGMKMLLIPEKNKNDIGPHHLGMEVVPVKHIEEIRKILMVREGIPVPNERQKQGRSRADSAGALAVDRIPPQSIEAEQSVLGAMLVDKEAVVVGEDLLRAEDFYKEANAVVFRAILNLAHQGKEVDILTTTEELRRMGRLDDVGACSTSMSFPSIASCRSPCAAMRRSWRTRRSCAASSTRPI